MAEIIYSDITLDVSGVSLQHPLIRVKQNDRGTRGVRATILNDKTPFVISNGEEILINFKRTNDQRVNTYEGTLLQDGRVQFTIPSWALEYPYTVKCDISIVERDNDDYAKLTTNDFYIQVDETTITNSDQQDDDTINYLDKLIQEVDELSDDFDAGITRIETLEGNLSDDIDRVDDLEDTYEAGILRIEAAEAIIDGFSGRIDSIESGKADKTISITGTGVLGGGGTLAANRTITHNEVLGAAKTTSDVYKIKIDKYGHISEAISAGLAAVATSGSYSDLSGTPAINNGTLTIQVEGTSEGTFTANQAGDTTINITAASLGLSSAMKFIGTTTTQISDGATTNPIVINGSSVTATGGNVALYNNKEFLWNSSLATPCWEELGDESSHALKTVTITGTGALGGGGSLESNRTITHNTGSAASKASGFYKISTDAYSHVSGVTAVVKKDLTDLITSMAATSGGTDLSLVTTGEKYSWNAKADASAIPTNYVTTDTAQTISGAKTLSTDLTFNASGQTQLIWKTSDATTGFIRSGISGSDKYIVTQADKHYWGSIANTNRVIFDPINKNLRPEINANCSLGSSSYIWDQAYAKSIQIKNTDVAYSGTPTNSSSRYLHFTDSGDTDIVEMHSTVGKTWNALNILLRNKSNTTRNIEFCHDASNDNWRVDCTTTNSVDLGISTRRWRKLFLGSDIYIGDTDSNSKAIYFQKYENDAFTNAAGIVFYAPDGALVNKGFRHYFRKIDDSNGIIINCNDNNIMPETTSTFDLGKSDKSFKNLYLGNTSGEGGIYFSSSTRTGNPIRFKPGDANGTGIIIGDGGLVHIGAGESAQVSNEATWGYTGTTEQLYLTSDNNIYFGSNCQTIANRKMMTYNSSGNLLVPGVVQASHSASAWNGVEIDNSGYYFGNSSTNEYDLGTYKVLARTGDASSNAANWGMAIATIIPAGTSNMRTRYSTRQATSAGGTSFNEAYFELIAGMTNNAANRNMNVYAHLKPVGNNTYNLGVSGTAWASIYGTNIYATSDRRLKENIKPAELNCSKVIDELPIREFNFKSDEDKKVVVGAIAQELMEILPEKYRATLISGSEDTSYSINEGKLLYVAIGALKEERAKTKELEARIKNVEDSIAG